MWTAAPWLAVPAPGAAVIMLDVIALHAINSEFGHAYGDRVITEIAHRMQRHAGERPVWRIGGDEFLIAMRAVRASDLRRFAHDLRIAIEERIEGTVAGVWMGGTIASEETKVADDLLRLADTAMYHAARRRSRELLIAPDDI